MQYEAKTPGEYLEALPADWRKEQLLRIRAMIQANGPELKEGIEYKMLCYGDGPPNLFHLNAQKAYVSLYVGDLTKVEGAEELLADFNTGKGCIRVKKSTDLSTTRLETFIARTIEHWRKGGDTGC